jgi:hypothetical protein
MKAVEDSDFFGFQRSDLIDDLPFENAKEYLKDGVTAEEWDGREKRTPEERIRDYMPFAWDKANGCRGLSAGRSVEHMKTWLWLDSKDELSDKLETVYEFYGKPCLVLVCKEYGIDWKALDDGNWVNEEDGPALTAEEGLKRHNIEV